MSMLPIKKRTYKDGRTKQGFKNSTDVNRLIAKHARAGTLSHLEQFGGRYGDFADLDFQALQNQLAEGRSIFEALPAEVRREFGQDPQAFFEYVNAKNEEELKKQLPDLAKPGTQRQGANPRVEPQTPSGVAREPEANENPIPPATGTSVDENPS